MDIERVQEIIYSPALINVNYYGIPVIIQQVHATTQTATVYPLNQMNRKLVVDIKGLTEEEPLTYMNGGITMNKQRAQEISQSPHMKNVTYNGKQIYIQHVDEQKNIARIFPLDDPENEFEVQIEDLEENNQIT